MDRRASSQPALALSTTAALSTQELLVWTSLLFTAASFANALGEIIYNLQVASQAMHAVEIIAWGCIAVLLRRDAEPRKADGRQIAIMLVLLVCSAVLTGHFPYGVLTVLGLFVAFGPNWSSNERRVGIIYLLIAGQKFWARLIQLLFADPILRLDTAAAGTLLRLLMPGSSWSGNTLRPPHDVGITVAMGCSSFANLSLVSLCFGCLLVIELGKPTRRRVTLALGVIYATVVVLNTARLILTARSLESFSYWHDGAGAEYYAIAVTVITVMLCSWGAQWAARRD